MYPNFDDPNDPYNQYNPGGAPVVAPPPPPPANWTDPDNPPPAPGSGWLYDGNQQPTQDPGPGNYWSWNGSQWTPRPVPRATQTDPPPPPPRGPDPPPPGPRGPSGPSGGGFDPSGFAWPQFNAPKFNAPSAFSYENFTPPGADSIFADPSYKMRRDEGLQAIEHGAAAKGLTRLPNTLKALAGWNQDFASREYGNIFDRSLNTYDTNRNNAANTYATNYGVSRDVFDRDYQGQSDMFKFNQYEPAKLTFDDMYRRWRDELDSTTRIATADPG